MWGAVSYTHLDVYKRQVQGGKGSVWGTIIGVLFYGILSAGFTSLHLSQYLQWVIMGAIMLFALSLDVLKGKGVKLWKRK